MRINYNLIKNALVNYRRLGGNYTKIASITVIGEKVIIDKKKQSQENKND